MKTPQEEAEELIEKAAMAWSLNDGPSTSINSYIRQEIPLPELIAVARAAARIGGERIMFEGSEHYAVVIEEVDELDNALQALRATGKVDGI